MVGILLRKTTQLIVKAMNQDIFMSYLILENYFLNADKLTEEVKYAFSWFS